MNRETAPLVSDASKAMDEPLQLSLTRAALQENTANRPWTPEGFVDYLPQQAYEMAEMLVERLNCAEAELSTAEGVNRIPKLIEPAGYIMTLPLAQSHLHCYVSHNPQAGYGLVMTPSLLRLQLSHLQQEAQHNQHARSVMQNFMTMFDQELLQEVLTSPASQRWLVFGINKEQSFVDPFITVLHEMRHVLNRAADEEHPIGAEAVRMVRAVMLSSSARWDAEEAILCELKQQRTSLLDQGIPEENLEASQQHCAINAIESLRLARRRGIELFLERYTPDEFAAYLGTVGDLIERTLKGESDVGRAELRGILECWLAIKDDLDFIKSAPEPLASYPSLGDYLIGLADFISPSQPFLRRLAALREVGGDIHPYMRANKDNLVPAVRSRVKKALHSNLRIVV